jgi:hypothetical protein
MPDTGQHSAFSEIPHTHLYEELSSFSYKMRRNKMQMNEHNLPETHSADKLYKKKCTKFQYVVHTHCVATSVTPYIHAA